MVKSEPVFTAGHCRLSQQIWQASRELSEAKALSRKRDRGLWDDLTQEEQGLVEAYGSGRLDRKVQNLMSLKTPLYKGVAASVSNENTGQRWRKRKR